MTKHLSTFIIKAVKTGDVKAVQRYIALHKKNHALLNASEQYKIGMGIFNVGDVSGWTMDRLTHLAIRHCQMKVLAELVACKGIDINLTNREFMTPLRLAVSYRNLEAVTILLNHPDIKIDDADLHGDTALIFAARMGNLEIVKMLLDHGANKNIKNQTGYNAADEAEAFGRQEIYEFIAAYQAPVQALEVPVRLSR